MVSVRSRSENAVGGLDLCGMDSFSDSTLKKNAHVNARRAPEVSEDRILRAAGRNAALQ